METITKVPDTKETLQFNVSFDPTNPEGSVEIKLPNGKTFTAKKVKCIKTVNLFHAHLYRCREIICLLNINHLT